MESVSISNGYGPVAVKNTAETGPYCVSIGLVVTQTHQAGFCGRVR
jgi:hypothetical protein